VQDEQLLTAKEVGDELGVSHFTVSRWAREGLFPAIALPGGKGWRFRRSDLDAFKRDGQVPA